MAWEITYYNKKVEKETLGLPTGILANFLRVAELVQEFGPELGRPHTAPLGDGLFEIRSKGREGIARTVFCTVKDQEIVILMTVIKKQNKIAKRHVDTIKKRMKEVQDE